MLTLQTRLRLNEAEVAARTFDGEAILINLSNGIYYSMDETAGAIWSLLSEGYSLADTVTALVGQYEVTLAQAQADVQRLAGELLAEHLLLVSDEPASHNRPPASHPDQKLPYATPALNNYRDMGALLALDPPMPSLKDIPWRGKSDAQ